MKRFIFGLIIALALPALAASQGKGQKLVLEFVDGPDLTVTAADKTVSKLGAGIAEGDEVPVGATIATGPATSAELRMKPNGTIIKLAKSTTFSVSGLASTNKEKNAFALVAGKIRAVAAKGAQYEISSRTAVCAVRGTDFSFSYDDGNSAVLMVAKGLVQYDKLDDAGAVLGTLSIGAGMAADAFAASFASFQYSPEQFAQQFGDVGFKKLQESDVPETAGEASAEPSQGEAQPAKPEAAAESGLAKWLRENLGFEIGSVTIDNTTYSKAIIQPNLSFGKTRLGLYLPIIYSSNLFDPRDWYHPDGNDEWSFGNVQFKAGDYPAGALDLAKDLALKIKYFEYGKQYQDPFFVKLGNLEDMTLGHGLIMRNYANDTDFPSVRRLGFDMGLDSGKGGFEALANDLTKPEIFGARLFYRPMDSFKLGLGISGVVDWDPASALDSTYSGLDLKLIGTGIDLDLPIVKSSLLGITAFADGAVTLPYLAKDYAGISSGLKTDLVWTDNKLKNWGAATGLLGNVLFIDWRLEYRYYTGIFRGSFFDSTYDRMRGQYAVQYLGYLLAPASYADAPNVMGIYGEGAFKLLNEKLIFSLGYMWPWSFGANSIQEQIVQSSDELHARLAIKKGLIPIFDLSGALTYDKRGLARSLAEGNFKLLDANSLFGGEVDIPVPKTPNLDLAIVFQTVPVRDESGNIVYSDAAAGIPELKPSVTIETRFHF